MCGPLLMGWSLGGGPGWRGGYLILGSVQFALVVLFIATMRLWSLVPERQFSDLHGSGYDRKAAHAANSYAGLLSAAIFALYVAVEGTMGLWAATVLVVDRSLAPATAAVCAAAYYGAIMGGRVLTGFVVERFGNRPLVRLGGLLALLGAAVFAFADSALVATLALLLTGLGFAPIYPCLMHEVPRRFVPDAVQTIVGRQSGAACLGGATMPALAGLLAQKWLAGVPWLIAGGVVVLIALIRDLDRRS
jgi:fucose permease